MSNSFPGASATQGRKTKVSRAEALDYLKNEAFSQIDSQLADSDTNKNDPSNIPQPFKKGPKTMAQFQQRIKDKIAEHLETQTSENLSRTASDERQIYNQIWNGTAWHSNVKALAPLKQELSGSIQCTVHFTTQGRSGALWQHLTEVYCSVRNTPHLMSISPDSSVTIGRFQGIFPDSTGVEWE